MGNSNPAKFDLDELGVFCYVAKFALRDCAKNGNVLREYLAAHRDIKETMSHICGLFSLQVNASLSALQRGLDIGYNRAGRIIGALEEIGVVTPYDMCMGRFVVEPQLVKLQKFVG